MDIRWTATHRDQSGAAAAFISDSELWLIALQPHELADSELSRGIDAIRQAQRPSQAFLDRCHRMDRRAISAITFHDDQHQWHIRFKPKRGDTTTRLIPSGISHRMPELLRTLGFEKAAPDKNKPTGPTTADLVKQALGQCYIILLTVTAFAAVLFFLATGEQTVDPKTVWRRDKRAILELSRSIEPEQIVIGFTLINLCIFAWFLSRVANKAKAQPAAQDQGTYTLYEPKK